MDTAQSKSRLLLVDGDPKSLRVLDVSLKKAGFDVTTATSGTEALALLEAAVPDLIISDTDLDQMDGFELCRQIKARQDWNKIPFLFVSGRKSIEDKIRGLELGVEDYLSKPIYIKEIGIRVRTALQRAERERMESRREGRTRFAGDLADVGVVDLVQTIELNRKSGIIHIVNRDNRRGSMFFRDGKVVDAEVGRLSGASAVYRLFSWSEGQFAVEFKQIRRHDVVDTPMAPLLMEGMRRLDETTRLLENLPAAKAVLEVDCRVLAEELAELPDEMNSVLRLCDGTRTLQEVVEDSDQADLEALTAINKLFAEQILFARPAPDRAGESEPGARLAHWLSEGTTEDGAVAEDPSGSSEFPAPMQLGDDGGMVPATTPGPTRTLKLPAIDALPELPPSRKSSAMSGEQSLGAVLPPREEVISNTDDSLHRGGDTLKGIPVDSLFAGLADPTPLPATAGDFGAFPTRPEAPSTDQLAPDRRSLQQPGLAERMLSDDSAVRASAMHEAMTDADGRISSQLAYRQTKEYGRPESTADLVEEVVSGTRQMKPANSLSEPGRPSKEVDWGEWAAGDGSREGASNQGPRVQPPIMPTPDEPPTSASAATSPASPPRPPVAQQAKLEHDELQVVADPEPGIAAKHAPETPAAVAAMANKDTGPGSEARLENTASATGLTPGKAAHDFRPEPDEVAASPSGTGTNRRLWLWAVTAFAAGLIGFLLVTRKPHEPPSGMTETAPTQPQPLSHPVPQPSAQPAVAPAKPSSPSEAKPAAPFAVSGLRQKCVEADAEGKGKAKAVANACRPVLEADPKDVGVMVILARAELDRGRLVEARSLAKKALIADPQRLNAYIYLGNAEQEAGKLEEARAAYKKYLELAPNGPFARELRAILSNL